MERTFAYRKWSRLVSIIQLVLYTIGLLFAVLICIFVIFVTVAAGKAQDQEDNNDSSNSTVTVTNNATRSNEENTTAEFPIPFSESPTDEILTLSPYKIVTLWIYFIAFTLTLVLQMVAAVKLFKATATNANLEVALDQAKFWRVIVVLFTLISSISYILAFLWPKLVATLLIHGVFVFIVWRYINELEIALGVNQKT